MRDPAGIRDQGSGIRDQFGRIEPARRDRVPRRLRPTERLVLREVRLQDGRGRVDGSGGQAV